MSWLGSSCRRPFGALVLSALAALAAAGCFGSGDRPDRVPTTPIPAALDLSVTYQRIDGFGASSAWTANNISDTLADLFFSPTTGIGLSLLRVQIKPTGITNELQTAKKAVARGAKVWAAPWSPPAEWKDNGSTIRGSLLDEHRADWANRLATFATTMAAEGVPLLALSAQNEPNYTDNWDTCFYTPDQFATFVRDFLGPALAAQGQAVPIMAPETQGWDRFAGYADPLLADPGTVALMGPLATHYYNGKPFDYEPARAAGKVIWQTEISDDKGSNKPFDDTIDSGLSVAAMIHDNLVLGNVSAWHYWWLVPGSGTGNGGLIQAGGTTLLPRAWVLGNWSRFVRPGFVRVAIPPTPQRYVYVTAFAELATGRFVIVAINQGYGDLAQDFTIAGGVATEVTPWVTSASQQLAAQATVPITDGAFTATLPARSVTTFVGASVTP